jgi:predicted nucleotidyltransferase
MNGPSNAPPAPRLRAIREAWLRRAIDQLRADPDVWAAGFVGSLGRGNADDWSDVDLLIVVPDSQVDRSTDPARLPSSEQVTLSFDARHNVPRGAGSVGAHYVIDGLPLAVDWYVYPLSQGAWVADAAIVFDRQGLRRIPDTFDEHLARRELQPPTPKPASAHRLLQLALIPVAAKRVVRRSPDASQMVSFVGGPHAPDATPLEHLIMLRQLLDHYPDNAPAASLAAARQYLDLAEEALTVS